MFLSLSLSVCVTAPLPLPPPTPLLLSHFPSLLLFLKSIKISLGEDFFKKGEEGGGEPEDRGEGSLYIEAL